MIQKNKTLGLVIIFVVILGTATGCNRQLERNEQGFIPMGTAVVEPLPAETMPALVIEEAVPVEPSTEVVPAETAPKEYHSTEDTNADCDDGNNEDYNYNAYTTRERAPQFTMLDINYNTVQLSDFYGKPIVLNFWASWCTACMRSSPIFNTLHQERQEMISDFHLLMVNILCGSRETRETLDYYLFSNNYTFPVFLDTQSGFRNFGVTGIPTTIFICAHGYIVPVYERMLDIESINNGIANALNCGCV